MFLAVALHVVEEIKVEILILLIINFLFSIVFMYSTKKNADYIFFQLIYGSFFLVYILKAIVQYFAGLDSKYVVVTIRTAIDLDSYLIAFFYVTIAHLVLIFCMITLKLFHKSKQFLPGCDYSGLQLNSRLIDSLLIFILLYTVTTAAIMFSFGVAVMGSDGVSLPFKLSGIFYYSRTIVIPLLLLYLLQLAIAVKDKRHFRNIFIVFILLSLSEIFVRATKAPLFNLIIYLVVLYSVFLSTSNSKVIINKLYLSLLILVTIMMWPLIEVYREVIVLGNSPLALLSSDFSEFSDQNVFIYSIQRLFQRMLGFLQFAGLVTDEFYVHNLSSIFDSGSIAKYYTQDYLNYKQLGHLSSPSLLGSAIILTGNFWPLLFVVFILISYVIWQLTLYFRPIAIPIKCILSVTIFNTMMAGNLDFFINDVLLLLGFSVLLVFICKTFNFLKPKKRS